MTAQDIITEVRQICQELDPDNTHASDSVILGWINACTLALCSAIKTLPKVSVSAIVAADTITFADTLLRVDYASISDGATPEVHSPIVTTDFCNFVKMNYQWEDTPDGKPSTLVRMTDLEWKLYPNPNATWTGKSLTVIGSVLPAPLTTYSQSPAISIAMHTAYPHYCAWKFFLLINNPERANAEYATFDGLRKLNTGTTTSTIGSLLSFKMGRV